MGQNSSNLNSLLDNYKLPIKFFDLVQSGQQGILNATISLTTEKIIEFDDSLTLFEITEKFYVQLLYLMNRMKQCSLVVLKYKCHNSLITHTDTFQLSDIEDIINSLNYDQRTLSREVSTEVVDIPELCKLLTSTSKWDGSLVFQTEYMITIIPFEQRRCNSLYFMNQLYRIMTDNKNKSGYFIKRNNSLVVKSELCFIDEECLKKLKKRL